ncbi:MAG TPA: hypothetical protein ENJ18_02880 [Nannocystis exedens]|nr:hypothetical protein [Nannocystis exedens]
MRIHLSGALTFALSLLIACGPSVGTPVQEAAPVTPPPAAPAPEPKPAAPEREETAPPEPEIYETVAGIRYLEMIVGGAKVEDSLPMVVAIHGLGDRPEHFAELMRGLSQPVRVILPAGIIDTDEGFSWFDLRARDPDVEALSAGVATAADRLATFVDAISAARPTTGEPIITGFSQGGIVSFTIATRHPDSIAAAYPVSGWLPPPLWPKAGPAGETPPIIALHGTADKAVKFGPTEEAVRRLQKLGYPVELKVYADVGHQITQEMRTELWTQLRSSTQAIAAGKPIPAPTPHRKSAKKNAPAP